LSAKWFNATTGKYGPEFSIAGGSTRSLVSEFGSSMSLLVLQTNK